MIKSIFGKPFLLLASLACAAHYFFKYYEIREKKEKPPITAINEVVIFSRDDVGIRKSKYSKFMITDSMDRLLFYLSTPLYTLDVCMYVLTNAELSNVILKLHYRGIKVRIIVDADMAYSTGSPIRKMEKQGIAVRWMKASSLMHHKFCLIDTSTSTLDTMPFVMTGSLNWTNQALNLNWENVIVTSHKDIVDAYRLEFERLWCMFKPIVMH